MTLKEIKNNMEKVAFLPNGEKVTIIKIVGKTSCMVLSGPDLDKYTYVQMEDLSLQDTSKPEKKCFLSGTK